MVSDPNFISSIAAELQKTVLNLQELEIKPQSLVTLGNLIFFLSYSTKATGHETLKGTTIL